MTRLTNRIVGLATLVVLMIPAAEVRAQSGNTIQRIDVREGPDSGEVHQKAEHGGGGGVQTACAIDPDEPLNISILVAFE